MTSVLGGASGLTAGSITSTSTLAPNTYTAYTFAAFVPVVTQPTFACQAGIGSVIGNRASGGADTFISDLYQYNLNTGSSTLVKANITEETTNRFGNALGYNSVDNYLWGFRIGTNQLVRIGSDIRPSFLT